MIPVGAHVVTNLGTVGRVKRRYTSLDGAPCLVLEWGPQRWITPVYEDRVVELTGRTEAECAAEAERLRRRGQ